MRKRAYLAYDITHYGAHFIKRGEETLDLFRSATRIGEVHVFSHGLYNLFRGAVGRWVSRCQSVGG